MHEEISELKPHGREERTRRVADIIEGHPLYYAESSATVRDVARVMAEAKIGAIAIVDHGKLTGVFSERDLMERVVVRGLDPDDTAVSSVMTRELVVADADDDIANALQKMQAMHCRHLPVMEGDHLVGMISLTDLVPMESSPDMATLHDILGEARVD